MRQLIDLEAVKEFMRETLEKVDKDELVAIAKDLEEKSLLFKDKLQQDKLKKLSEEDQKEILQNIFVAKRKTKEVMDEFPVDKFRKTVTQLLYGQNDIAARFQDFYEQSDNLNSSLKCEIAGELLHFAFPDKYWLWARWMWDPKNKTGAVPLVTTEGFDLEGNSMGEIYMKVGNGVAFVHSIAEAAEFQFISRTLFGTDVFLCCVYVIYAYTVLRMRMTKEFNNVMPGLSEFSRRLLGVHKVPSAA